MRLLSDGLPVQVVKDLPADHCSGRRRIDMRSPRRSRLQPVRAWLSKESGGADGDRTHDLRLAKPALSQLSYSPEGELLRGERCVEGGLQTPSPVPRGCPPTPGSMRAPEPWALPGYDLLYVLTNASYRRSPLRYQDLAAWWAQVESNYRPHPYQGCALAD